MMRSSTKGLLLAVLIAGLGCDDPLLYEERDHTFTGDPVVEFAPTLPDGSYSMEVTFPSGSDQSETVAVGVQYIGTPPESAVSGSFGVTSGSAVQGEHYTLPGGTEFTIPAGENRAEVSVELLGAGLDDGEEVSLTLELSDGQGYTASANYSEFQVIGSKEGG